MMVRHPYIQTLCSDEWQAPHIRGSRPDDCATCNEQTGGDGMRPYGPKKEDHFSVGNPCPACDVAFAAGDYTTLIPLGPGPSEEERRRCRHGRPYNAVAVEVHWGCATGQDDAHARSFVLRETQ